ncbi:MAG: putative Zn-dependent protease [Candidatus Binatia bacterium]|jgi:predicted Zn-dependent protease
MKRIHLRRLLSVVFIVLAAPVLTGCYTVPETGRRDLMLYSPEAEMKMGFSEFDRMKSESKINKDPKINAMVTSVGKRIAAVAELPNAQWEFVVFENPSPNAFCLPGGKIGIHTGILPITKNEAGLATVMGHEVAHAVARHGGSRMSKGIFRNVGGQIVGLLTSQRSQMAQKWSQTAYGVGSDLGMKAYSRSHESEADKIGLWYMARAGFDPQEAVYFWQRFAEYNRSAGGDTAWFLRTHPLDEKRVENLQALMPEAKRQYRPR